MQPKDITPETVTVSVDDLFAMLYRVPMYARDGAFSRIAAALPSFDTGREQCIECEQFRAVDLLCDCEQDMEAPR